MGDMSQWKQILFIFIFYTIDKIFIVLVGRGEEYRFGSEFGKENNW